MAKLSDELPIINVIKREIPKTDEEPVEVIKLDDDVVYNLKQIDTNEFK